MTTKRSWLILNQPIDQLIGWYWALIDFLSLEVLLSGRAAMLCCNAAAVLQFDDDDQVDRSKWLASVGCLLSSAGRSLWSSCWLARTDWLSSVTDQRVKCWKIYFFSGVTQQWRLSIVNWKYFTGTKIFATLSVQLFFFGSLQNLIWSDTQRLLFSSWLEAGMLSLVGWVAQDGHDERRRSEEDSLWIQSGRKSLPSKERVEKKKSWNLTWSEGRARLRSQRVRVFLAVFKSYARRETDATRTRRAKPIQSQTAEPTGRLKPCEWPGSPSCILTDWWVVFSRDV